MDDRSAKLKVKSKKWGAFLKTVFLVLPFSLCTFHSAFAGDNLSSQSVDYYNKAVDAYKRRDYDAVNVYLKEVLNENPDFAEAFFLKGWAEYDQEQYEQANADLERAYQLKPSLKERVSSRIEGHAHHVESQLTQQEFSRFEVSFEGAEQRDQAWDAVKALDEGLNDLQSLFGIPVTRKIQIIIFTAPDFVQTWMSPFVGGFFDRRDGKIRLRVDETPGGDEEFRRRARHELTHAYFYQLLPKELPQWFQEGTAQYYAYLNPNDQFWKDNRLHEIAKEIQGAPWLSMAQINSFIKKKNVDPRLIYLGYLQSEALVLYTAKEQGDSWIPNMLQHLRQGEGFEQAFQSVAGVTSGEMMDKLHGALQ